jgi:hypothetical protein
MPLASNRSTAAFERFPHRVAPLCEGKTNAVSEPRSLSLLERMALAMGSATAVAEHLRRPQYAEATDDTGRTPLMLAASYGHEELCRVLIAAGMDFSLRDSRGFDAMAHAHRACHAPVVEFLSEVLAQRRDTEMVRAEPPRMVARPEVDLTTHETWNLITFEPEESQEFPPDQSIVEKARELQNLLASHVAVTGLPIFEADDELLTFVAPDEPIELDAADRVAAARSKLDRLLAATPRVGCLTINVASRDPGDWPRPKSNVMAEAGPFAQLQAPTEIYAEILLRKISSLVLPTEFLEELCVELRASKLDREIVDAIADCIREYDSARRGLWRQYITAALRGA